MPSLTEHVSPAVGTMDSNTSRTGTSYRFTVTAPPASGVTNRLTRNRSARSRSVVGTSALRSSIVVLSVGKRSRHDSGGCCAAAGDTTINNASVMPVRTRIVVSPLWLFGPGQYSRDPRQGFHACSAAGLAEHNSTIADLVDTLTIDRVTDLDGPVVDDRDVATWKLHDALEDDRPWHEGGSARLRRRALNEGERIAKLRIRLRDQVFNGQCQRSDWRLRPRLARRHHGTVEDALGLVRGLHRGQSELGTHRPSRGVTHFAVHLENDLFEDAALVLDLGRQLDQLGVGRPHLDAMPGLAKAGRRFAFERRNREHLCLPALYQLGEPAHDGVGIAALGPPADFLEQVDVTEQLLLDDLPLHTQLGGQACVLGVGRRAEPAERQPLLYGPAEGNQEDQDHRDPGREQLAARHGRFSDRRMVSCNRLSSARSRADFTSHVFSSNRRSTVGSFASAAMKLATSTSREPPATTGVLASIWSTRSPAGVTDCPGGGWPPVGLGALARVMRSTRSASGM